MNLKDILKITSIPIFLASLCCLAPVVLVFLGISSVAYGASLAGLLDGKYKIEFLSIGTIALVISLVIYFRKKGVCTLDQAKRHRNEIINKVSLVLIATVVGYVLFFNVFLGIIGTWLGLWHGISWNP